MKTHSQAVFRHLASIAVGLLSILSLSGCATTTQRTYEGSPRPESEVGLLLLGGGFSENLCRFRTVVESIDGIELSQGPRKRFAKAEVLPGEHTFVLNCYFEVGGTVSTPGVGTVKMAQGLFYPDYSRQTVRMKVLAGHQYQVRYNFYGQVGWGTTTLRSLDISDVATTEMVHRRDIPVLYVEPAASDASAAHLSTQGDNIRIASIDAQVPCPIKDDERNPRTPVTRVRLLPGPHEIEFVCSWQEGAVRIVTNIVASAGANYTASRQMQGYSMSLLLHEAKRQDGTGQDKETGKE